MFYGGFEETQDYRAIPSAGITQVSSHSHFVDRDAALSHLSLLGYFDFTEVNPELPKIYDRSGKGKFGIGLPVQEARFYTPGEHGVAIGPDGEDYPTATSKYSVAYVGGVQEYPKMTAVYSFKLNSIASNQLETSENIIPMVGAFGISVGLVPPNHPDAGGQFGLHITSSYPSNFGGIYPFGARNLSGSQRWATVQDDHIATVQMRSLTVDEMLDYMIKPMTWVIQAGPDRINGSPGIMVYLNNETFAVVRSNLKNIIPSSYTFYGVSIGTYLYDFEIYDYLFFNDYVSPADISLKLPKYTYITPVYDMKTLQTSETNLRSTFIPKTELSSHYRVFRKAGTTAPTGTKIKDITCQIGAISLYPYDSWGGDELWEEVLKEDMEKTGVSFRYLQYKIVVDNR
jgi:hypothetical protein